MGRTPMTEIHPVAYEAASTVSYAVHRRYRNFIERDDLKQVCYEWALNRDSYIREQLSVSDPEQRQHNERKIAWQMMRNAERVARKEKASKSGYHISDEVYYESFTLGQLLPFVIASIIDGTVLEQAQEMMMDGQPKGSSSPSEGGNILATLLDIKKGYLALEEPDKDLLRLRYHENLTLEKIGGVLGCSTSTADRKCSASMRRLQQILGGETPWA
jgi:DNA-directed RNA polymerase specialized sigma24 family protein